MAPCQVKEPDPKVWCERAGCGWSGPLSACRSRRDRRAKCPKCGRPVLGELRRLSTLWTPQLWPGAGEGD